MEKITEFLIQWGPVIAGFAVAILSAIKAFKFKEALVTLIDAAKDAKITEEEFQSIVDAIKKDIY